MWNSRRSQSPSSVLWNPPPSPRPEGTSAAPPQSSGGTSSARFSRRGGNTQTGSWSTYRSQTLQQKMREGYNLDFCLLLIQIIQLRWSQVLQKLTNNILVMLRDELFPVARIRRSKVDVDKAITWSVQVGLEGKQCVLVGDILVFGVKIVDELHPRQNSYTYKQFCYSISTVHQRNTVKANSDFHNS